MHTIVIAAGGTGGHFFPAEALAAELAERGHRIVLMTDSRSGGLNSPVFAARERFVLPGAGIAGRGALRGAKAAFSLAAGVMHARKILTGLNASAVVGFGGYPCVGPILGARLLGKRPSILLHEQNAVLGRANRFLSANADVLALSFEGTARIPDKANAIVTGNPVRPAIAGLARTGYAAPDHRIRLLVLGGSLGARVFSDVVPEALKALPDMLRARLSVVQQCRAEDIDRVRAAYAAAGIEAELASFFTNVADRLVAAHLVIARAGASTVSEIAVVGRPSILVPLPSAIDDHQTANARALAKAGGAVVMPQPGFTPEALAQQLETLLSNPVALVTAAVGARSCARPDAAARLADTVEARITRASRPAANRDPVPAGEHA